MPLAGGDQGNSSQRGQQSYKLPAAEVLFQNKTGQKNCDRRVQRCNDDSFIEPSSLIGRDEQGTGCDIKESSNHAEAYRRSVQPNGRPGGENRNAGRGQ